MKYALSIIFGLLFIGATALWFRSSRRLARNGVRTTARVVELRKSTGSSISGGNRLAVRQTLYEPVLAFRTAGGQDIQAVAGIRSNSPVAQPGDVVRIIYDPAGPSVAKIDSALGRGTAIMPLFGAIGIGLIVFALYHLL